MASMTAEQWAMGLIDAMQKAGYKVEATPNNISNIERMIGAESSGNQAGFMRDNNPWNLNTYATEHGSLPGGTMTTMKGSAGETVYVQQFNTVADGYAAYINQFKANPTILHAFEVDAPATAFGTALSDSGWKSGHYASATTFPTVIPFTGSSNEATLGATGDVVPQAGQGAGNAAQLSTSSSSGLTPAEAREIDTPYTGPGAYKGFDIQGITAGQRQNVERAIDTVLAQPGGVKGILDAIYKNYGSESWMANIPEVRTILVAGSYLGWDSNKALFDSEFQNTNWYKTTAPAARNYQELIANDPASINGPNGALANVKARVTNEANTLGVQLTDAQLQSIAETVVKQSISNVTGTNIYDQTLVNASVIDGYIGAAAQTPAFAAGLTGTQEASTAGITGATQAQPTTDNTAPGPGGDAAYLYNQFTTIARNYMLNWTPQQIAAAVQKALASDTGQGNFLQGQIAGFQTTAQNTAKALYPAFAGAVGTNTSAANNQDMYQATQSYRNIIAQFTGNADADSINLNDPQWSWILSGGQPPPGSSATLAAAQANKQATSTSGGVTPPTIDELQTYLMGTPQFQTTNMAKEMGWQVGSAITKAFGF